MTRTGARALVGCCLALAIGPVRPAPALAQVSGTIDFGLSSVRYDGFLRSGAVSVTPSLFWEPRGGRGIVSARATYLRFESGNHSLDGQLRGAFLAELGGRWRGEISASIGASEYANFASFDHGLLEGRLHRMSADHGFWVGAGAGRASFGSGQRPVITVGAGAWWLWNGLTVQASLDRSTVGDTVYSDARAATRWRSGALLVEASAGTRFWSRGGGRGVYFETSATVDLNRHVSLVLGGGRYPTDVISGSIAGRYVTVALRVGRLRRAPTTRSDVESTRRANGSSGNSSAPLGAARIEIADAPMGVRLLVHAPAAGVVELAGDFSDWQPVLLARSPGVTGSWEIVLALERGIHRLAIRIDGAAWVAPSGTTRIPDDYGGEVGILVVP
ncbi:MAG: glycogen-binding domain-containing protein [Gemmatimonadales bacterium]